MEKYTMFMNQKNQYSENEYTFSHIVQESSLYLHLFCCFILKQSTDSVQSLSIYEWYFSQS